MQIVDYYLSAWKNAFVYSGRARRSEYWYFVLGNFIVALILSILAGVLYVLSFLSGLYSFAVIFPTIALSVRRLHDISKSGWFYLFILIPLVGWIFILVWACTDSTPGPNQYGPNPKGYDPAYGQGYQQPPYQGQGYQQPPYQAPSENKSDDPYKGSPEL